MRWVGVPTLRITEVPTQHLHKLARKSLLTFYILYTSLISPQLGSAAEDWMLGFGS